MSDYFYDLQTIDNVSKNPSTIYGKINQYKMEVLPEYDEDEDFLTSSSKALREHYLIEFNSELIQSLCVQIRKEYTKKEATVAVSFLNEDAIESWDTNGNCKSNWIPEKGMVYTMDVHHIIKTKTRTFFQLYDGMCFIVMRKEVKVNYNINPKNK